MSKLTKQLVFVLLSSLIILIPLDVSANYPNALTPVYTKGDDSSRALVKPGIIYEDVEASKITIPNMPSFKTQDYLGECRAFSLATIMQKYTCDEAKDEIPNCKNVPSEYAISYFGMMMYTNQDPAKNDTFYPNQNFATNMYSIIKNLSNSGNKLILDSCKPFDKLINNFSTDDKEKKIKKFFTYLNNEVYLKKRSTTEAGIVDCPECIEEIYRSSGLKLDMANLKKALVSKSYNEFLYSLFFGGCKLEQFPLGFNIQVYPTDKIDATPVDIKNNIILGLKRGKPVMFPALCLSDKMENCDNVHSLVISGYKKVCDPSNKSSCKDVFKVHNSWGEEWQRINNDGWVDADILTQNTLTTKVGSKSRIVSDAVVWIE